jgi:hypothetical protein
MQQSQGVSIGAPQVSQSEDWIACVWRRVASQAGVFTRAYLRNAATDWSYGSALLHRFPSGVLRGKAALQHASVHSAGVFKIDPQSEQLNGINLSLPKIDPQSKQLNGINRLVLVVRSTQLACSNRQPVPAAFCLDNQPI